MYSWQLITSTGFLFGNNASQAFYINQLGGILAAIGIVSTLSYIFAEKDKKSLLSLPVLFAALYYVMPMTVFQQAKDMKLDPAYLFFAVSGFMLIFSLRETLVKNTRDALKIVALAGLIV
jgi:4-amino-4-deoxy-L-arabinose transferase-like glycosyltransferase